MKVYDKRPSELRVRDQLPNGQLVSLYFIRKRTDSQMYQWHIGLFIGGTRKQANLWFTKRSKKYKTGITGDGSLTGLRWAKDIILRFVDALNKNEELVIGWDDSKRGRAYQWLKRYGFIGYYDEKGKFTHLGIRNTQIWEWLPD